MERIKEKQAELEVLERLLNVLDREEKDCKQEYVCVGTSDEQETHWKTGEPLWEDEEQTKPKYKKIYDYVDVPEDKLSDKAKVKLAACAKFRTMLEKLI